MCGKLWYGLCKLRDLKNNVRKKNVKSPSYRCSSFPTILGRSPVTSETSMCSSQSAARASLERQVHAQLPGRLTQRHHALDGTPRPLGDLGIDGDLVAHRLERPAD